MRAGHRIEGPGAVIVPLTSGNAELGRDIYRGCFRMAGVEIDGHGSALFDGTGGHPDWQEILHGFGWLEHLRATGRELGRVHARALISDWIGRKHRHHSPALTSAVMARRLMSWIHHLPFYLEGAGDNFSRLLFRSMTRQVRVLQYRTAFHRRSAARLPMMLAVCHASVGLRGLEQLREQNLGAMADLLVKSLYADGGHISRNPAELAGLLLDLLPLRKTCEEAGIQLPAKLHAAIERMLPMLRFFTHGDGGIAMFQGSGDPLADSCCAIFSADPVAGRPVTHASHSGYARLAAGALTTIVDAGLPAPDTVNRRAALSPLAFEFSDHGNRVVINCGSPQFATREGLIAARLPEAHSTATLNAAPATSSRSMATWLSGWGRAVSWSPRQVEARIETSPVGVLFEGRHDAYLASTGYLHARSLFLSAKGNDLRGEDHFQRRSTGADVPATIRFHLHPAVKATMSKDGQSIMLLLPSKAGWRFSVRGAELSLEDSISFGSEGRHRTTVQIVLRCSTGTAERVHWAFKRIERRQAAQRSLEAPELPL
ncbi:MAG: heparinase II/III family protein [Pseudomonadota bacterium]|nr:heparinase II/III family protein [Pseudomonadota bacterium]